MCPLLAPVGQEELLPVADNVEYLNRLKIHKHFVIFRTFLLKSAKVLDWEEASVILQIYSKLMK